MMLVVLLTWNEFWEKVGDFFSSIGYNLYTFWINPQAADETSTDFPYLATFIFAILVLVLGYFLIKLIIKIIKKIAKVDTKLVKDRSLKSFLINALKYLLYVLLLLLFLSILGVSLDGVSEILSSAIIAIGLSLQDVISNFASGFIILTSKPFVIGDYVYFNNEEVEGTVVDVKFLSTVLLTSDNQEVTIPNANITNATLTNYSRMPTRRLNIELMVDYDADVEEVKKVALEAVATETRILNDPLPVAYLTTFNDHSYTISVRCYSNTDDYSSCLYNINETIFKYFKEHNIRFGCNHIKVIDSNGKDIFENDKK